MACSMLWLGVDSLGNPNQFDLLDDKRLGLGWWCCYLGDKMKERKFFPDLGRRSSTGSEVGSTLGTMTHRAGANRTGGTGLCLGRQGRAATEMARAARATANLRCDGALQSRACTAKASPATVASIANSHRHCTYNFRRTGWGRVVVTAGRRDVRFYTCGPAATCTE